MCKDVAEDDEDDVKEAKIFATKVRRGVVLTYLNMAAFVSILPHRQAGLEGD